jgi:hypothetical protein
VKMMEMQVGNYTAVVTDEGTLKLSQATERHIAVVNASPEGTTVKAVPYSSISPGMAASLLLSANWAGDGYANIDVDCGAQRWNGTKSLQWVRTGLYRAGFDKGQVDSIFHQMRKNGPQSYVGRCW